MSRAPGVATLGAVICVLAAGFGEASLYVPGATLLLAAAIARAWVKRAARAARVQRIAGRGTVEEGQPLEVRITLECGPLPLPGGELVPWPGAAAIPLAGTPPKRFVLRAWFPRRGRQRLEPALLRIRDPLGLCARELRSTASEILVLPAVQPVSFLTTGESGREAAEPQASAMDVDVDGLRPHQPGAPASRIHWPAVARTGTLIERRLTAEVEQRPLIVVDASAPADDVALDQALRAAASLCVHLAARGGCTLLLPGDRRSSAVEADLHGWPALHARLAVVEAGSAVAASAGVARSHSVFWVTGGSSVLPVRDCWLVSPRPLPGVPVAFTVAGCSGQRVHAGRLARVA